MDSGRQTQPLADRRRPQTLADFAGQEHLVGSAGVLVQAIQSKFLPSMVLWGPPGCGKTTLAKLLAAEADYRWISLNAVQSGVKDVRAAIDGAKDDGLFAKKTVLFIDEIHRFSKSQQDSLLSAVEKGHIILIGATTENPSFSVIAPLLSRLQVYTLKSLTQDELKEIVSSALKQDLFFADRDITIQDWDVLFAYCGGDARRLLNAIEIIILSQSEDPVVITNELVQKIIHDKSRRFSKTGEEHYDIASALIKSIRGSDANAAIYWLARLIAAGETVDFIARRLIIAASEDIGNANPNALVLANATLQAVQQIGMPEGRIILAQCTTYLATSPKSNASYLAIDNALRYVEETGDLPVPLHIRNAPTQLMKDLDYGKGYLYPHDYPGHFVPQSYLPEEVEKKLKEAPFFVPGDSAKESREWQFLQEQFKHIYPAGEEGKK